MVEIAVRDYEPEDFEGLLALVRELQVAEGAFYDRVKPPEEISAWYIEGLLQACLRHRGRILVAEGSGGLLGYAVILTEVSSKSEPDEVLYHYAYVQDLAVTEASRGQGLGSRLLADCEAIARDAGAKWLRIGVLADNEPAVRAYDKAGFKPLTMEMEKLLG